MSQDTKETIYLMLATFLGISAGAGLLVILVAIAETI